MSSEAGTLDCLQKGHMQRALGTLTPLTAVCVKGNLEIVLLLFCVRRGRRKIMHKYPGRQYEVEMNPNVLCHLISTNVCKTSSS